MKKIIKITIKRMADEHGEADYLGVYSSTPGPEARTIDREARGDCGRHEHRYFIAANSPEETGNPESVEQDYKRMEAGMRGEWCLIGIRAEAEVHLTGDTVQRITFGGLWGIESDSEENYFKQIETEELANLNAELLAIGFTADEIKEAFEQAETKTSY
jgi:hypothetical protein